MSRVIGDYWRDSDRVHLAPCAYAEGAEPYFAGQGMSLHEIVRGVANAPAERLCRACWPQSALEYEQHLAAAAAADDQPDGIDSDSLDLPDPARVAERVAEFLSQFGDGRVPVDCVDAPLYARDVEALRTLGQEVAYQRHAHEEAARRACEAEGERAVLRSRANDPGRVARELAHELQWQLAEVTRQRDLFSQERRQALDERDDAVRRAQAVEAERDQQAEANR